MDGNGSSLYGQHLAEQFRRADRALELTEYDSLLIASGSLRYRFLDDNTVPFTPNPLFRSWAPEVDACDCWIVYTPGQTPTLIYHQPADYWHVTPTDPQGEWTDHFQVVVARRRQDIRALLPTDLQHAAILGPEEAALDGVAPNNPATVLAVLHYHRAVKTEFELDQLRAANRCAARAHRAAEAAFRAGESEWGIHLRYLAAAGQSDLQLPYGNIIALNEHAAVLHYQKQDRAAPAQHRSFLIDAGADHLGYAADITRSYAAEDGLYADLVSAMEEVELSLVSGVVAGRDYAEIHLDAHQGVAQILEKLDIITIDADQAVATGVSKTFFPHGIGHLIGLQVHDVAGFQADETGSESIAKPDGHPFLRLTRTLQEDFVVTIEPGIYFIPMLLDELRAGPNAAAVNWETVEALLPYGGVRVEDDVRVTADAPENLSRNAFADVV